MNIKEQIKAEVDARRQNMVNELMGHEENCEYHRIKGMHDAYVDMLTYLDYSIPEEKPSEDLEQEISGMYQALFGTDIINRKEMVYLDTFTLIARHFAEWQKEQDDKELSDLLTIAHLQGADQMKEQMMKDAVEGMVHANTSARWVEAEVSREDGFICGDKVRIIIIKED